MNQTEYFSQIVPNLSRTLSDAISGQLRLRSEGLSAALAGRFSPLSDGHDGLVGDVVFEPTFGWQTSPKSMGDLAGNLLSRSFVDSMANPPAQYADDYAFSKERHPYTHQVEAWHILRESLPQSIVVTSGTGSGKTECFMVPILDSLVRELDDSAKSETSGVQALFLYPLNALINSQRDRLTAWTSAYKGKIRFCLYNGDTPNNQRSDQSERFSPEVSDRKTLRANPPQMLMTNSTMLEYMLVRAEDQPILDKSRGKLKWIVIDEAHTYLGSQAAELSLLLRRVLLAFDVSPNDVHFIATSATIGDGSASGSRSLRQFLCDVGGVAPERVHVVNGQRFIPQLPEVGVTDDSRDPTFFMEMDSTLETSEARYLALSQSAVARQIRKQFVDGDNAHAQRLASLTRAIADGQLNGEGSFGLLQWLDLLSGTRNTAGDYFLPLRAHIFCRGVGGVWACVNPKCSDAPDYLQGAQGWHFGAVYFARTSNCSCGAPVAEVVRCWRCSELYLETQIQGSRLVGGADSSTFDEFELKLLDDLDEFDDDDQGAGEVVETSHDAGHDRALVINRDIVNTHFPIGHAGIQFDGELTEPGEGDVDLILADFASAAVTCPTCGTRPGKAREIVWPMRIGAPSILGPLLQALLEFAPDGKEPQTHPYRGRRILSFSDSRQGTARLAARLQQESERSRIRGLCYHAVLEFNRAKKGDQQTINRLKEEIELLRNAGPTVERIKQQKEDELAALENQVVPLGFHDLARSLANQEVDFDRMSRFYRDHAPDAFGYQGTFDLAAMFILREFGRRPKWSNNLETMGMVNVGYPRLDSIQYVPLELADVIDFSVVEWRAFLKILIDTYVRDRGAMNIPKEWINWIGLPFRKNFLVEPGAEGVGGLSTRFSSHPRSQVAKWMARMLRVEPTDPDFQDRLKLILAAAWKDLTGRAGILRLQDAGYQLFLEDIAFTPTSYGWLCPVTRRVLDTTVRGVTRYAGDVGPGEDVLCEDIEIPLYPMPFGGDTNDRIRIANGRDWLLNEPGIQRLREKGIWTDLNDKVVELTPFYLVAEHSAQQTSRKLLKYEKDFRSGDINVLSCSTTMEMGIDIGGIAVVAMSNVPSHPANYLQRAGRAGRRGEGRSLVLTFCRERQHDQSVFGRPDWAFHSPVAPTPVALDSRTIVSRHVNAFLLGQYFRDMFSVPGRQLKFTVGKFFLGDGGPTDAEGYLLWLESRTGGQNKSNSLGITTLVAGTTLEGMPISQVCALTAEHFKEVQRDWMLEWSGLDGQQNDLRTSGVAPDDPAMRAIEFSKKRLGNEFLLRELTSRGFLPIHGFPTDIVSFNNVTAADLRRNNRGTNSSTTVDREDNMNRARGLPSRDAVSALREYAPGATIVIDGVVYESAGVSLNWHLPASLESANELQSIRIAWRCRACGAAGSVSNGSLVEQVCNKCGQQIESKDVQRFLEPAGFAVDLRAEPNNDVTKQTFISVAPPWLSCEGEWREFSAVQLGRYRVTNNGYIFFKSMGQHGSGYDVCLVCGRAEPNRPGTSPLEGRRRLRGGGQCPGEVGNRKVLQKIAFAHETKTDMLEVQLRSIRGDWLDDPTIALSLAVAMRSALALLLGIETSELGVDIAQAQPEAGVLGYSIFLFDRFQAGYSSSSISMAALMRETLGKLKCPASCDRVCPACLLDADYAVNPDRLDRLAALEFLSVEWVDALSITDAHDGRSIELTPVDQALLRKRELLDAKGACLRLGGDVAEWRLAASPLIPLVYKLLGQGVEVAIATTRDKFRSATPENQELLNGLTSLPGVRLVDDSGMEEPAGLSTVALLSKTTGSVRWAASNPTILTADESWGFVATSIFRIEQNMEEIPLPQLEVADLLGRSTIGNASVISIHHELDGSVAGFGTRFWNLLVEHSSILADLKPSSLKLQHVIYSDRYLASPLTVALLVSVLDGLREWWNSGWTDNTDVAIETMKVDRYQSLSREPRKLGDDWRKLTERDQVLRGLGHYLGLELAVKSMPRNHTPHARKLSLLFYGGTYVDVFLDQGFSYWSLSEKVTGKQSSDFGFSEDVSRQVDVLAHLIVDIVAPSTPTYAIVSRREA